MLRQQPGLHVMQVRGAHDDVGRDISLSPMAVGDPHPDNLVAASPDCPATPPAIGPRAGENCGRSRTGVQSHPVVGRQPGQRLDKRGETPVGVTDPVSEIEPAHEVVDGRGAFRGRPEEHRRVAENLLESSIRESLRDK